MLEFGCCASFFTVSDIFVEKIDRSFPHELYRGPLLLYAFSSDFYL